MHIYITYCTFRCCNKSPCRILLFNMYMYINYTFICVVLNNMYTYLYNYFFFQVNLPKPPDLIGRLIVSVAYQYVPVYALVQYMSALCVLQVLAGHPHNGEGRGEHVLNCMKAVVPNLHEDLVDLWDAVIPKLLSYLSGMCIACIYMFS